MADPLSFVASIIAVANVAENVATKGYVYLKAVRQCCDDVKALVAEVNALCGVLQRLDKLLDPHEAYNSDSESDGDEGSSKEEPWGHDTNPPDRSRTVIRTARSLRYPLSRLFKD